MRGWLGRSTGFRTLSNLWGGVNSHGVNVRDQCGVCDDVTVQRGWMGRSSGSGRIFVYTYACMYTCNIYRHGRGLVGVTDMSKAAGQGTSILPDFLWKNM